MKRTSFSALFLLLALPLLSIGQLENVTGNYYALEENDDGSYFLSENCWSMQLDMLSIEATDDQDGYEYALYFNSFHAESYLVFEVQNGHNVSYLSAYLEDDPSEEVHTFELRFRERKMSLIHVNYKSETIYASTDDKAEYPFVPCQDEEEFVIEDDSNLDLQAAILAAMNPLFTGEEIAFDPFVGKDGFEFISPGPGVHPIHEQLRNLSTVYTNTYFEQFVESAPEDTWSQLPFFFDDPLPHFCTEKDVKRGVYVSVKDSVNVQLVDIIIFMKDGPGDSNGMKMQFVLDEDGELEIRMLQINECAA